MLYTPRHIRQFNERQEWVNALTFYLLEERYYKQGEEDEAEFAAERLLCHNLDEGGELMEEDAVKFFKEYVREILEENVKPTILALCICLQACSPAPKLGVVYTYYEADNIRMGILERCRQEAGLILLVKENVISQEKIRVLYRKLVDSCAKYYRLDI